jgi:hypothetical protein
MLAIQHFHSAPECHVLSVATAAAAAASAVLAFSPPLLSLSSLLIYLLSYCILIFSSVFLSFHVCTNYEPLSTLAHSLARKGFHAMLERD